MKLEYKISTWLDNYLIKHNFEAFIVGISGGIDSAVTSTLCAMTGKKNIVLTMPIYQNKNETDRGKKHIMWLKNKYDSIEDYHIDLTSTYESIKNSIPLKRFAEPSEIANLVTFLCSEKNSYITGQVIIIDGGYTCK